MASLFPPLPVFMDLAGRAVVVLAGDPIAARFARDCLEAGAGVTLIDPAPSPQAEALIPAARLLRRRWKATDLRLATLVAAGAAEGRAARARQSAKAARAIFLMLDGGPEGDVSLGAATVRGPLTIGVSTAGLPGALAAALEGRISAAAPPGLSGLLEAAARGAAAGLDGQAFAAQRRFWDLALKEAPKVDATGWGPAAWDAWLAAKAAAAAKR
jgi:siroheme synthase-like protein